MKVLQLVFGTTMLISSVVLWHYMGMPGPVAGIVAMVGFLTAAGSFVEEKL